MDGVSAIRAYTLLAVLAILAGGWMLNEAPEADLIEPEMDTFAEIEAAPASAEDDSGADQPMETRKGGEEVDKSDSSDNLPTGLVAGGGLLLVLLQSARFSSKRCELLF